jgi:hydroxyacid-oxoacid transhydrogenase
MTPVDRLDRDSAFEMAVASVRYGAGVTSEIGMDLADGGLRRALIVTDPVVARLPPTQAVVDSLDASGVTWVMYDRVRVEPSEESWLDAIDFARGHTFDAIVGVGGGSSIDTAKAVNLYTTHPPADFLDYVNKPIGQGLPVPGPLKPLFAIPTTAGTGSETTGVAIFDLTRRHVKTGISSRLLKPTLGVLDPNHTRTAPPAVAASAGLDILCHAVESYTAVAFTERPRPARPSARPPYQGANPISDVWSLQALRMVTDHLVRAVEDPGDDEARASMVLAASFAGIGFGNAGVHLPHAMAYPVAGRVTEYRAPGYPADHALVPHGFSVILNAPAVFAYTGQASPERHLEAAAALGADVSRCRREDAGRVLADRITWFMQRLNAPNGLAGVGYSSSDIPALVEGTLAQERLTTLSPRLADADALARIFETAMHCW